MSRQTNHETTRTTSKKWILPVVVILVLGLLAGGAVLFYPKYQFNQRQQQLLEAASQVEAGKLDEADAILAELLELDHPGAAELEDKILRIRAERLTEAGQYADALKYAREQAFSEEEIAAYDRAERYHRALTLAEDDANLEEARAMFLELGDYEDSAAQADDCALRLRVIEAAGYAAAFDFDKAVRTLENDPLTKDHPDIQRYPEEAAAHLAQSQKDLAGKIAAGNWYTAALADSGAEVFGLQLHQDAGKLTGDRLISGPFTLASLDNGRVHFSGYDFVGRADAEALTGVKDAAVGYNHVLVLNEDGTVAAFGQDQLGKFAVSEWKGVQDIAAGLYHSAALLSDGSVVSVGANQLHQLETSEWQGVTQIAAGMNHTVGLLSDGTVVACGDNSYEQCEVGAWKNAVAVYAAGNTTYALFSDGTVAACGNNEAGQCDVEGLKEVATLAPGGWNLTALHRDGTLSFIGLSQFGEDAVAEDEHLVRYALEETFDIKKTGSGHFEQVLWPEDKEWGPWVYASTDFFLEITLSYREDCRSRFYIANIYTPGGEDYIVDGLWTENGRAVTQPVRLAQKYQAIYGQNCNYWTDPENTRRGPDIRNGVTKKTTIGPDFMYFDADGQLLTCYAREQKMKFEDVEALNSKHVYGFGPIMIHEGEIATVQHMQGSGLYGTNPRSAFGGVETGHYVGMVVDGRKPGVSVGVNMSRLAEEFLACGCKEAYNLDGGQSSCMLFLGEQITNHNNESMFNGQRPIPDMLILGTSELCKSDKK